MIAIYVENNSHLLNVFDQFVNKTIYQDIHAFKASKEPFKIALVSQITNNQDYTHVMQFKDFCTLVFVIDHEFHEWHPLNTDQYKWTNMYWWGPGYSKKNNEYIICFQQHLHMMQQLYSQPAVSAQLDRLQPYQPKSKSFDALLGRPRPPRVFVMEQIKKHNLESHIISNIFSNDTYNKHAMDQLPGFVWEDDYVYHENRNSDINCNINYHGAVTSLGNIIPISTYNQTAFSILSETEHNNSVYMLTEKTAKVTLGRRVFVAFAGPGFLQLLRDTGFKTFDGIIDESYDQIENDQDRWQAAFDQVITLCYTKQSKVISAARPILEHNFDMISNYPWWQQGTQLLAQKLNQLVNNVQSKI
jgi:hypothetical protein